MTLKASDKDLVFIALIEKLNEFIDIICECEKEKHVQDILASLLNCKSRQTISSLEFPDIELDIIGNNYVIEVKYNEKYYSGFGQLIAQRFLYKINNLSLIHVNEYLNSKFISGFFRIAEELKILGILIDKRNKELYVRY